MFLLLSSNALQGLTHVNKAVYVCGRFCLQMIACLFKWVLYDLQDTMTFAVAMQQH